VDGHIRERISRAARRQNASTVFVPTGLIGSDSFFWTERLSCLWRSCGEDQAFSSAIGQELGLGSVEGLQQSIAAFKQVPATRREFVLRALEAQFANGTQPGKHDKFMSWEQLLAMAPVFEAASHTVSHILLDIEEPLVVESELRESLETLQENTGTAVQSRYPAAVSTSAFVRGQRMPDTGGHLQLVRARSV